MEKKVWEQPLTMVQQFMPNEYVAACGDENKVYLFTLHVMPAGRV